MVGQAPGRAVIKELQARLGAGGEAGIGLDAALELRLERRVFGEVLAGQFFQHVGFAVLALLKRGSKNPQRTAESGASGSSQ